MGRIPEEIIAQVIDRCDIVEVISNYVSLKKAGRNFKGLSPFTTEKTPSFVVSPDKQIFHCFSTGIGGNVISFIMKHERMEFPEAVRFLADTVGITIPEDSVYDGPSKNLRQQIFDINQLAVEYYHKVLLFDTSKEAKYARDYLKNRNIQFETVERFKLGLALNQWSGLMDHLRSKDVPFSLIEQAGLIIPRDGKEGFYDRFRNRIIFPIFDGQSHCRAFGARALGDDPAKYINSPETPVYTKGHYLYGFNLAKQAVTKSDAVVVVEGYMDCIIPHQSGVDNVIASLGTALTVEQIRLMRRYTKNIVFLYDMDRAGETAMLRSIDTLIEEGMDVKVAQLDEGEDPDSYICKFGVEKFNACIDEALTVFDYKLKILISRFGVDSVENKAKICAAMLPTINKFDNEIIRSGYVEQLAGQLKISEKAVKSELNIIQQKSVKQETVPAAVRYEKPNLPARPIEKIFLRLILEDESFIGPSKENLDLADFQDENIRGVISTIFTLFDQGHKINGAQLINHFETQEIKQMLSDLLTSEDIVIADKNKMYSDYVNRFKQDRLKKLKQSVLTQMQEAEMMGQQSRLEELKERFNQLIKG